MGKPGDDPDAALAAICEVVGGAAGKCVDVHLLHRSNNVVARIGTEVAKVMMADDPASFREFELASHGSKLGAPVLRPVREPSIVGGYVIT